MLCLTAGTLVLSVVAILLGGEARASAALLWAPLLGYMLLDLALSWRRSRRVRVEAPSEVFVGETAHIKLVSEGSYRNLTGRLSWTDGLRGPADFAFQSGETGMQANVLINAAQRGAWQFDRLWLKWRSRFGLFEILPRVSLDLTVRVVPNIRLVQSGKITSTVVTTLFGVKENRAIGEGSEFHQLRDFVPGMDIKSIDWKRSAKKHALVAKELRAERNHHVIIALDNGYLMREEVAGVPKIDHAITAGLATAWAAAIGGDLVGYFAFDVRPRSFVKPEPGRLAFSRLRSWSADLDYETRETNHTLALSELNARTPKRSLIIVFTDFVDTTSAELLVDNLAVLGKRHLVVFVALRDPQLDMLATEPPANMDSVATLVAASEAVSQRRLVFEKLNRLGITVLDVAPHEVSARLISTYLDIKARELI